MDRSDGALLHRFLCLDALQAAEAKVKWLPLPSISWNIMYHPFVSGSYCSRPSSSSLSVVIRFRKQHQAWFQVWPSALTVVLQHNGKSYQTFLVSTSNKWFRKYDQTVDLFITGFIIVNQTINFPQGAKTKESKPALSVFLLWKPNVFSDLIFLSVSAGVPVSAVKAKCIICAARWLNLKWGLNLNTHGWANMSTF